MGASFKRTVFTGYEYEKSVFSIVEFLYPGLIGEKSSSGNEKYSFLINSLIDKNHGKTDRRTN